MARNLLTLDLDMTKYLFTTFDWVGWPVSGTIERAPSKILCIIVLSKNSYRPSVNTATKLDYLLSRTF